MSENIPTLTTEQAVNALFTMIARLSALLMWALIWCAHLTFALALLLGLWAAGLTPADVKAAGHALLQTWPFATAAAAGASVFGLLRWYGWLVRWVHQAPATKGWLFGYLTKGL